MADKSELTYAPREEVDGELERAIGEILSAEDEAKRIVAQAEASVKAIQLDAATRERSARENVVREGAALKAAALEKAHERAEADSKKLVENARQKGKELTESKRTDMERCAKKLFAELTR